MLYFPNKRGPGFIYLLESLPEGLRDFASLQASGKMCCVVTAQVQSGFISTAAGELALALKC